MEWEKTVRGTVEVSDCVEDDSVVNVLVAGEDGLDYIIDPRAEGLELSDCLDEYVEVRGFIHRKDGRDHLFVTTFELIEEDEEVWS
jgi:hypothetical protein